MASSAEGINMVRFFFYRGNTIDSERKTRLVALAYATARQQLVVPKAILIRADLHKTTSVNGYHVPDPNGWHGTFAFKSQDQVDRSIHVASHGYTSGKEDFGLVHAIPTEEKRDDTPRGGPKSEKIVWPREKDLEVYKDSPIAYSHLAGEANE